MQKGIRLSASDSWCARATVVLEAQRKATQHTAAITQIWTPYPYLLLPRTGLKHKSTFALSSIQSLVECRGIFSSWIFVQSPFLSPTCRTHFPYPWILKGIYFNYCFLENKYPEDAILIWQPNYYSASEILLLFSFHFIYTWIPAWMLWSWQWRLPKWPPLNNLPPKQKLEKNVFFKKIYRLYNFQIIFN